MLYLTSTHATPPRHVELNGMLHPTAPLIKANDTARLAELGIYPHITVDGPAPLGYTAWELIDGEYHREPAGTEQERNESLLATAKSSKYQERLDALLAARNAGFTYDGHRFESDRRSRELIQNALSGAMLAQSLGMTDEQFAANISGGWRNTDGVAVVTTIQGMISLFIALGAHMGACDLVSQGHKAAIEACTTADECNALNVTIGYS